MLGLVFEGMLGTSFAEVVVDTAAVEVEADKVVPDVLGSVAGE